MVPIWSARLPCSSHSAAQKIDHSRRRLRKVAPVEADAKTKKALAALEARASATLTMWRAPAPRTLGGGRSRTERTHENVPQELKCQTPGNRIEPVSESAC
jgi:hypothetical protein